jgi:hypothetical protein
MRFVTIKTFSIRQCGYSAPLVADQTVFAFRFAPAADFAQVGISSASATSPSVHSIKTAYFRTFLRPFWWFLASCFTRGFESPILH